MRFDAATTAFMEKVATDSPSGKADPHPEASVRSVLSAAKKLTRVTHDPGKLLPQALIGMATKELLKEGGMPPLQVYSVLNQHYGRNWWDWEPETIWVTLAKEQGIHTDTELKNMLMAFQVIVQTNAPFEHWHVFEKVGHALNQNPVEFQIIQPLELTEIALTMKVLRAVRPAQGFEEEVYAYVAAAAKSAGVVFLPEALFGKAQSYLDDLQAHTPLAKTLAAKVSAGSKEDSEALKIQRGRLKEIEEYVETHGG